MQRGEPVSVGGGRRRDPGAAGDIGLTSKRSRLDSRAQIEPVSSVVSVRANDGIHHLPKHVERDAQRDIEEILL